MVTGIHHLAIISDSEKSVDFYLQLGFQEYKRVQREHDLVVLLRGYDVELEIFVDSSHPVRATKPEQQGLRHMALHVDSIENTVKELGICIGPIGFDWNGVRFAFTSDPDGLPIELHE